MWKQVKNRVAQYFVSGILSLMMWFFGWLLYDDLELWRQYTSDYFRNWLSLIVLVPLFVLAIKNLDLRQETVKKNRKKGKSKVERVKGKKKSGFEALGKVKKMEK